MRVALALLLTVTACAGSKPPPKAESDVDAQFEAAVKAEKEHDQQKEPSAPSAAATPAASKNELPPFTGEQIRAATKPGRMYRYRVEAAGKPTHERVLTFTKVDEGGAEVVSGSSSRRIGWRQLQSDSEWPKDKVTMHEESGIKVPAGKFDCLVYELRGDYGETVTFFFAKNLPGAPILFYTEQDGRRIKTTTLLQHVQGKDT